MSMAIYAGLEHLLNRMRASTTVLGLSEHVQATDAEDASAFRSCAGRCTRTAGDRGIADRGVSTGLGRAEGGRGLCRRWGAEFESLSTARI